VACECVIQDRHYKCGVDGRLRTVGPTLINAIASGKSRLYFIKSLRDVGRLLGSLLQFPSEPRIAGACRAAIQETCGFNPRILRGLDLNPLVIELRNAKCRTQALKGREDFPRAALSEAEDRDSRTMNERDFSVVQVIAITGEKSVTVAEREGGVVLVWMTSQVGFLDSLC
jgi:hypothetical protein